MFYVEPAYYLSDKELDKKIELLALHEVMKGLLNESNYTLHVKIPTTTAVPAMGGNL